MAEDASEKRAEWLEEKLPDILVRDKEGVITEFIATSLQGDEKRDILLKAGFLKRPIQKLRKERTTNERSHL